MTVAIIAAMTDRRVIGKGAALPWHLPEDLKRFKAITMGHPIVMGRKTFESIGRPLPGRENVVLSRDGGYRAEGVQIFRELPAALQAFAHRPLAFIIGGAKVFEEALPLADFLHLTLIHRDFDGDVFFPALDLQKDFEVITDENRVSEGGISFSFVSARRRR